MVIGGLSGDSDVIDTVTCDMRGTPSSFHRGRQYRWAHCLAATGWVDNSNACVLAEADDFP